LPRLRKGARCSPTKTDKTVFYWAFALSEREVRLGMVSTEIAQIELGMISGCSSRTRWDGDEL